MICTKLIKIESFDDKIIESF